MEGLCRTIAAQSAGGRLAGPLICLIWSRLRRLSIRVATLLARIRPGAPPRPTRAQTQPSPVRRHPAPQSPPPPPAPPSPLARPACLPRRVGWLVRLVPASAPSGSQLQHLLSDPEMAALVAASPEMRRLLRGLCRMLGVRLPPAPLPAPEAPPAAVPPAIPPAAVPPPTPCPRPPPLAAATRARGPPLPA